MPKVEKEITVAAPLTTVYQVWHNFENFPRFMNNIEEVRVVGGNRSHWRAKGPLGRDAEWDAEITLDEPERTIGWRSIPGNSNVDTAGRVNFDRIDGATRLRVMIQYEPKGGVAGEVVAKIFANPERQIEGDLKRFKEAVERGPEQAGFTFEPVMQSGVAPGTDIATADAGTQRSSSPDAERESLGGSMGATSERDLEQIEDRSSGVQPADTDDPAVRQRTGEDFGHSKTKLPDV